MNRPVTQKFRGDIGPNRNVKHHECNADVGVIGLRDGVGALSVPRVFERVGRGGEEATRGTGVQFNRHV